MARSSTWVSWMGWLAWAKPTQPAAVSSAISVSAWPFRPTVRAPSGYRCASPRLWARYFSISTRPGSSSGGSVSGGQASAVTPPATAACISDSSEALYSKPGSRRRADRSTSPGDTTRPVPSMVRAGRKPWGAAPTAMMRPSATCRSACMSSFTQGSTRRAPVMENEASCPLRPALITPSCIMFSFIPLPACSSRPCALQCRRSPAAG